MINFFFLLTSLTLLGLVNTAIMVKSPGFLLTRVYQYRISLVRSTPKNNDTLLTQYINFVSTRNKCQADLCYYGWISNYTIKGQPLQDFNGSRTSTTPIFMLEMAKDKENRLTINTRLDSNTLNALNLSQILLYPSYLRGNTFNASTFNSANISQFRPLIQAILDETFMKSLNEIKPPGLAQIQSSSRANDSLIACNIQNDNTKNSQIKQMVIVDKTNRNLFKRYIKTQKNALTSDEIIGTVELVDNSIFLDLTTLQGISADLKADQSNVVECPHLEPAAFAATLREIAHKF